MICPIKDKDFLDLENTIGSNRAYGVYAKNNNQPLYLTEEGKPSPLFEQLEKVVGKDKAVLLMSNYLSDSLSQGHDIDVVPVTYNDGTEQYFFKLGDNPSDLKSIYATSLNPNEIDNKYDRKLQEEIARVQLEDELEVPVNPREVLTNIANSNLSSPYLKQLAESMMNDADLLDRIGVKFTNEDNLPDDALGVFDVRNEDGGVIKIDRRLNNPKYKELRDEVVLHEMIHSYTMFAMKSDKSNLAPHEVDFREAVEKIYEDYLSRANDNDKGAYGFSSPHEFVAELANPKFVDILEKLDYKSESLWDKIINAISRLFVGVNPNTVADLYSRLNSLVNSTNPYEQTKFYQVSERATPEFKKAEYNKPISNTNDWITDLFDDGNIDMDEQSIDAIMGSMRSRAINGKVKIDGEEIDVTNSESLKNEASKVLEKRKGRISKAINWINSGADESQESLINAFGKTQRQDINESQVSQTAVKQFKEAMNYIEGKKYYYAGHPDLEALGVKFDSSMFNGNTPIIGVIQNESGINLDVIYLSNTSLSTGLEIGGKNGIFNKYISPNDADRLGIRLPNNMAGILSLQSFLATKHLKMQNPNAKISASNVLFLGAKSVMSQPTQQQDLNRTLNAIKSIKGIYDNLSLDMKELIDASNNPQIGDGTLADYTHILKNELSSDDIQDKIAYGKNNTKSLIDSYTNGDITSHNLVEAFKMRQKFILNIKRKNDDVFNSDYKDEYMALEKALFSLNRKKTKTLNKKDEKSASLYLKDLYAFKNSVVSYARDVMFDSGDKIVSKLNEKKKAYQPLADNIKKQLGRSVLQDRFTDPTDVFRRSFKKKTFKTKDGKTIDGYDNRIYLSKEEAMADGVVLTDAEIEHNNFVADSIRESFIQGVIHNQKKNYKNYHKGENGKWEWNEKVGRANAEQEVDDLWERGRIPLMRASFKEAKGLGAKKDAFVDKHRTGADLFDENYLNGDLHNDIEVYDYFYSELHDTRKRQEEFGLTRDSNGELIVFDEKKFNRISQDLESITMNQYHNSVRKIEMEDNALSAYNTAMMMLNSLEQEGISQDNNRKILKELNRRLIQGKGKPLEGFEKAQPIVNMMMSISAFSGIGLNVGTYAQAKGMNWISFFGAGQKNKDMDNGFFTKSDARKASKLWANAKNRKKMKNIAMKYGMALNTEKDFASNPLTKVMDKNLLKSDYAFYMLYSADLELKSLVMTAQLIHDGIWDAHNEEGEYNEDLDPRWKDESNKGLKEAIKDEMIREGIMDSQDERMTRAYSLNESRSVKFIADKEVIGGMDSQSSALFFDSIGGRVFGMFKRYLPAKIYNLIGTEASLESIGRVKLDEDENGNKMPVWDTYVQQGMLHSLSNSAQTIYKYKQEGLGLKEAYNKLTPTEKTNLNLAIRNVAIAGIMLALYGIVIDDPDDKDDIGIISENALLKRWKYTAFDTMNIINPLQLGKDAFSAPFLIDMAENIFNIGTGDLSGLNKVVMASNIKLINETLLDDE